MMYWQSGVIYLFNNEIIMDMAVNSQGTY